MQTCVEAMEFVGYSGWSTFFDGTPRPEEHSRLNEYFN